MKNSIIPALMSERPYSVSFSFEELDALTRFFSNVKNPTEKEKEISRHIGEFGTRFLISSMNNKTVESIGKAQNISARSIRPILKIISTVMVEIYQN